MYTIPSSLVWLVVVHFTCPRSLLCIILQYLFIAGHNLFEKQNIFCYVSVENYMWKNSQEGFFCFSFVKHKHQSNEHSQAGTIHSQWWIWMFWVCQLSHMWYNVDYSQLTSRFDRYQLQQVYQLRGTIQQETSSRKLCKPLLAHLISHSTFSIHWTKLSIFFFSVVVFTFL